MIRGARTPSGMVTVWATELPGRMTSSSHSGWQKSGLRWPAPSSSVTSWTLSDQVGTFGYPARAALSLQRWPRAGASAVMSWTKRPPAP